MAEEADSMHDDPRPRSEQLGPPPRQVQAALRWHLLGHPVALVGSGLFSFSMFLVTAAGAPQAADASLLFVLLVPLAGLLVALGGLGAGWRRYRLVRDGLLTQGTLTRCAICDGEDTKTVSLAEAKQHFAGLRQLRDRLAWHPVVRLAPWFGHLWTAAGIFIMAGGTLTLLIVLGLLLTMPLAPRERAQWLLCVLGFAAIWLTMGNSVLRNGPGTILKARDPAHPSRFPCQCEFSFRLPTSEIIEAWDQDLLSEDLDDEPPRTVLYHPDRPRRAVLLAHFTPHLRLSPGGEVEADVRALSGLCFALVLFLLVGPLVVLFL
jgi:hypothetical protein